MRCAILGSPVAHSLSPAMHRAAYRELGLDWTYEAVELEIDELAPFLGGLDDSWRGLSVTAPLKRPLVTLADEVTDEVRALGVANTMLVGRGRRLAHNTDVSGAVAALAERDVHHLESARILGGGATAASMARALASIGLTHLEMFVRDTSRAHAAVAVAREAGVDVEVRTIAQPMIDVVDLLVSTVPGEAIGARSHELVESARAVFDVVYDPWPTGLSTAAEQDGRPVVTGLDLLAHQASLQVALMTEETVGAPVLRKAALDALAEV